MIVVVQQFYNVFYFFCSIFLDMVGCIVFNSMTCSAEEVVRTLNRDLWGIIGKNVTGFDSTTCYGWFVSYLCKHLTYY